MDETTPPRGASKHRRPENPLPERLDQLQTYLNSLLNVKMTRGPNPRTPVTVTRRETFAITYSINALPPNRPPRNAGFTTPA